MAFTFDQTFDSTFSAMLPDPTPLPVGVDDSVAGTVLPLRSDGARLSQCRPDAVPIDRLNLPLAKPDTLLPLVAKSIYTRGAEGKATGPLCAEPLQLINALTGEVITTVGPFPVTRLTDNNVLFLRYDGSPVPGLETLPDGIYQVGVGDGNGGWSYISEPFRYGKPVLDESGGCSTNGQPLWQVRLSSPARLGDLPYDASWQQSFWIEGDLDGPTYEEKDTVSSDTKTGGTVNKFVTLVMDSVPESVAEALSLAGITKTVAIGYQVAGAIAEYVALDYQAATQISTSEEGGFEVSLKLLIGQTVWSGSSAGGCLTDSTTSELREVECE